jgi:hypothetical protein
VDLASTQSGDAPKATARAVNVKPKPVPRAVKPMAEAPRLEPAVSHENYWIAFREEQAAALAELAELERAEA